MSNELATLSSYQDSIHIPYRLSCDTWESEQINVLLISDIYLWLRMGLSVALP